MTSTTTHQAPAPTRSPGRARPRFIWPLRVVLVPYAALLVAQPVLAGRFLEGSFEALRPHGEIGGGLIPLTWLVFITAVLAWRPGRLGVVPLATSAALSVLTVVQVIAGYSRTLGLHLPLGVAIIAAGLTMLGWAWLPRRLRSVA